MSDGRFFYVPLDVAATPVEGHAYVNKWWCVHPEKGVAFWYKPEGPDSCREPRPQCNPSEELVRRIAPEGCEAKFLPIVFRGNAWKAMRQDMQDLSIENQP